MLREHLHHPSDAFSHRWRMMMKTCSCSNCVTNFLSGQFLNSHLTCTHRKNNIARGGYNNKRTIDLQSFASLKCAFIHPTRETVILPKSTSGVQGCPESSTSSLRCKISSKRGYSLGIVAWVVGKFNSNGLCGAFWNGTIELLDGPLSFNALIESDESNAFREPWNRTVTFRAAWNKGTDISQNYEASQHPTDLSVLQTGHKNLSNLGLNKNLLNVTLNGLA